MKTLSVIVPCYNEQESVPLFYEAFIKETADMPVAFEFLFVDDGSGDNTLNAFRALRERDPRVHYISFSRNFGKESAMFAGMEAAQGDYVAIMDVDLQDPPSLLPEMLRGIEEDGYDCVATRRVTRKGEPKVRSFFARAFYRLINKISKTEAHRHRPALRRARFPADDEADGGQHFKSERGQPLFQRNFQLGGLPDQVA